MNKLIGLTAILTIAMFAAGALAAVDPNTGSTTLGAYIVCSSNSQCGSGYTCVNSACDPTTCGISATGISGVFTKGGNNLLPGDISDNQPYSTVSMTGNTPEQLYVQGAGWIDGGSNTMPVGATAWALSGHSYLALTGGWDDMSTTVGPSSPVNVYFQLTVPSPQMSGTYNQAITFGVNC